jgi:hypothetical protein
MCFCDRVERNLNLDLNLQELGSMCSYWGPFWGPIMRGSATLCTNGDGRWSILFLYVYRAPAHFCELRRTMGIRFRDVGVAGSNPVTPTIDFHTKNSLRISWGTR